MKIRVVSRGKPPAESSFLPKDSPWKCVSLMSLPPVSLDRTRPRAAEFPQPRTPDRDRLEQEGSRTLTHRAPSSSQGEVNAMTSPAQRRTPFAIGLLVTLAMVLASRPGGRPGSGQRPGVHSQNPRIHHRALLRHTPGGPPSGLGDGADAPGCPRAHRRRRRRPHLSGGHLPVHEGGRRRLASGGGVQHRARRKRAGR